MTDEEKAYLNDQYWLKYLDPQDFVAVQCGGDADGNGETEQQTRDRRNRAAIQGAYRDARQSRSEDEALAFVLEAIEGVKTSDRYEEWSKERIEQIRKERAERGGEADEFDDDIPF